MKIINKIKKVLYKSLTYINKFLTYCKGLDLIPRIFITNLLSIAVMFLIIESDLFRELFDRDNIFFDSEKSENSRYASYKENLYAYAISYITAYSFFGFFIFQKSKK